MQEHRGEYRYHVMTVLILPRSVFSYKHFLNK